MYLRALLVGLLFLAMTIPARATVAFDRAADLARWKTTGPVTIDTTHARGDHANALQLGPASSAFWTSGPTATSGSVSLWVLDDGTKPGDPHASHTGPRWGIVQPDGHVLVVGDLYAPYLAGDTTYAVSDSDQRLWFEKVQYLGLVREPRWRHWVFNFDPDKGLTISLDDKLIQRFDWNQTEIDGFSGVALFGDSPGSDHPQTLWVDDVEVQTGPPMQVHPTPPPPPAPVVPDRDPAPEGPMASFLPGLVNQHPRLLLSPQRIPALRAFYNSDAAKPYRDQMIAYLGACIPPEKPAFLDDATDGQRQGLWRMPTVALHYVMTGDKTSLAHSVGYLKMLLAQPHWENPPELDSGMSTANIMIGAALTYDWLYNDLDPGFREQFRQKLWRQARAMYYGGHLMGNPGNHYWQNDPLNNHRWHRDAGLTLAALAAYTGAPDQQWLLNKVEQEDQLIDRWLPADGSSHESSTYLVFGGPHLLLAMQAADECLGTHLLDAPFFKNVGQFRLETLAPGMRDSLHYGDSGGVGFYNNFILGTAAHFHQADVRDGALHLLKVDPEALDYGWMSLVWDDPTLTGGDYTRLPTTMLYPDLGLALLRENWQANAVAAMFKCGPMGGYSLDEFSKEHDYSYVNVAHDDPDANSFVLLEGGDYVAETDRYSAAKRSSNYNTILIDGMGQMPRGRTEPQVYSQPGSGDMTQMARITAWKDTGPVVVAEGEAAGSYLVASDHGKSRPALNRFRRTFIWVKGSYLLVLDDIRAPQPVDVTWLMQGASLDLIDAASGRYRLSKNGAQCDFQVRADQPFQARIVTSTADDHGKLLDWRQLQAQAHVSSIRFASVYDAWRRGNLAVTLAPAGPDDATVTVTGPGINDTWRWQSATGQFEASTLHGSRPGVFTITVDAKSAAPPAP